GRGIRVEVPRPIRSIALMKFAVTSPLFIHLIYFIMRTLNGQRVCPNYNLANVAVDARNASGLSGPQAEFLDCILFHGTGQLAESLKLIHDLALYHTDVPFDEREKTALFDLKVLWEGLERMEKEA
ncbi:MAG: hypothetical protein KDD04_10640, partial [Sinomicrobium sp.]|nr:hypothetical protein [Sinomicrobium sp.]